MVAPPAEGVGLREIARDLGISEATIRYWTTQGWVRVLQPADGPGRPMVLDRQSVVEVAQGKVGGANRRTKAKRLKRVAARARLPATHHPTPPSHPPPHPSQPPTAHREGTVRLDLPDGRHVELRISVHLVD